MVVSRLLEPSSQRFPKSRDLSFVTKDELEVAMAKLNNRPRKKLE